MKNRRERVSRLITWVSLLLSAGCQTPPPSRDVVRQPLLPPAGTRFAADQPPVLSPDGRRLALVPADAQGETSLWLHRLDKSVSEILPGTQGATYPFWSPDSEGLGYFAEGKLKTVRLSSGETRTLCDAPEGRGGAWSREGVLLFAPRVGGGLHRVSETGGPSVPVTRTDAWREEASHRWPQFLPDGRHFLFFVVSARLDVRGIHLGSLDTSTHWLIASTNSHGEYVPSGHILFVRDGDLWSQPFDGNHFELTGGPRVLAEGVGDTPYLRGCFSTSQTGTYLYGAGSEPAGLVWRGRNGERLGSVGPSGTYTSIRLSPDGKTVAVTRVDPVTVTSDIWLIDVAGGEASRLTATLAEDSGPVVSASGDHVMFSSNRAGSFDIYRRILDGDGEVERVIGSEDEEHVEDESRDGRILVYSKRSERGDLDLWAFDMEDRTFRPLTNTPYDERQARWSPDGRWLAYASNESGAYAIYIQPYPALDRRWRVSPGGGYLPTWREDGKELYYIAEDGNLMVTSERTGWVNVEPRVLFSTGWDGASLLTAEPYAAAPDGERFLVYTPASKDAVVSYTVVRCGGSG